MARIFISSTFKDLEEYRKKVSVALRQIGHEDVAMEYFVAEDKRPLKKCQEAVTSSDLYVGIFALRYGYKPPRYKKSITELEYRKAVECGINCLIFLLHEEASWPVKFVDKGEDSVKLESLRKELSKKYDIGFFKSPDELAKEVLAAVHNWEKETGKSVPEDEKITGIDLKQYTEAIIKKYCILDLDSLTPPDKENYLKIQLGNVFVEQNVRENPPPLELPKDVWRTIYEKCDSKKACLPEGMTLEELKRAKEAYYSKEPKAVLDAICDGKSKYVVILGDPGSGKSTLTRYIVLSLLHANDYENEKLNKWFNTYLPLLIELREFAGLCSEGRCKTFLDYFQYLGETQGYKLKKKDIDNYLKNNGKALVIFDGLDEVFDPSEWEKINRMIVGFTIDYPKVSVIVTSRIVGYKRKILDDAGFIHSTLQDFEKEQITNFLDKWYRLVVDEKDVEVRKNRIIEALENSSSIKQLSGNPLLLTILAIISKHQELPKERWKLFDHATDVLVKHWEVNKHLKDESIEMDSIGEEDKKELLMRIASKMQAGPHGLTGNFIHKKDLQNEIAEYLRDRFQKEPDKARFVARSLIEQLRKRNFVICLYGADFFGFVHRTFLEYFCAKNIVEEFNDQKLDIEELKRDYYIKYWEDPTWHEVLRLICGMKEKLAGEIIECLMQAYDAQYFGNRPPLNISLATKCLSELRNPNAIGETAKKLLERVLKLFEMVRWTQDINEFLGEEIVPAAKMIGSNWPHRDLVIDQFNHTQVYMNYYFYMDAYIAPDIDLDLNNAWAEFVAEIGSSSEKLYEVLLKRMKNKDYSRLLAVLAACKYIPKDDRLFSIFLDLSARDKDSDIRYIALQELARSWHGNHETLNMIKQLITTDKKGKVRGSAILELARRWHDDLETLNIVKRAINDFDWFVRSIAVGELARGWPDDPEALSIVKKCATTDKEMNVRKIAIEVLSRNWHDNPETLNIIKQHVTADKELYVRRGAIKEFARGWPDDPETLNIIKQLATTHGDYFSRSVAIEELAHGWHDDPETLSIIKKCFTTDKEGYLRSAAIEEIARGWPDDPETLNIIKQLATTDKEWYVRSAAIRELARGWHDDHETLKIIQDATTDNDGYVKSVAIGELARGWHDDPETLKIIQNATTDKVSNVRTAAIRILARGWHDNPKTLNIIKQLARIGKVRDIRGGAIEELACGWHDDPETLNIIKQCATTDRAAYVRSVAIKELACGWHDDHETLNIIQNATTDRVSNVRIAAIEELARGWDENSETLNIITDTV